MKQVANNVAIINISYWTAQDLMRIYFSGQMGASGVLDMVTGYWTAQNLKTIRRGQVGASGVG